MSSTCSTCEHWVRSHVHDGLGVCAHKGSDPAPPWVKEEAHPLYQAWSRPPPRRPVYVPPEFTCEDHERRRPKQWEAVA